MSQEPPAPLDYRGTPPGSRAPLLGGVILGLVAGSLLSFVVYWLGMAIGVVLAVVVLVIKVFVGTRWRKDERRRGVAIGVLLSIATGTLIFLGLCGRALEGI